MTTPDPIEDWAAHLDRATDPQLPDPQLPDPPLPGPPLPGRQRESLERIAAGLADRAVWAEPPPGLRESVLRLAAEESAPTSSPGSAPESAPGSAPESALESAQESAPASGAVVVVPAARWSRRRRVLALVGVAAAAVIGVAVLRPALSPEPTPVAARHLALTGTALAPGARAEADLQPRPAGLAVTLHVTGLAPAPADRYYAAWLVGPGGAVPVGSFHWRRGGVPIELWSGVSTDRYPQLVVTLQREGAAATLSDQVVLTGQVSG